MKSLSSREWLFLTFIFIYSFIPTFGGLLRVGELLSGLAMIPENPRAIAQPLPILLHIVSSFCFCLFGALQFLPTMRRHRIGLHRKIGKVVAIAGCVSALTGLWMTIAFTFPAELQGPLLYWVRIIMSILMIVLIAWAVFLICRGDITKHSSGMIRAYAIGQGASTQTAFGIFFLIIMGEEAVGFPRDILMVSAWALNLLIVEVIIQSMRTKKAGVRFIA
ncbi:MAG: DUF2306 domain-containing protein [Pseudomonadota bacterium]